MLEFEIDANILSNKLKSISYIINGIDSKSLLAILKIQVANNRAIFSLSGASDRANIYIECTTISEGECYIIASSFISILQTLTGTITLQLLDKQLIIKQTDLCIKLATCTCFGLFDGIPINQSFEKVASIPIEQLSNMALLTIPFVNTESNNSTKGVCLRFGNNTTKAISCNGPSLALANYKGEILSDATSVVLRPETLSALRKVFANESVEIYTSSSAIKVTNSSGEVYAAQLNGTYPPLEKIIENSYKCLLDIWASDLEYCLKCITALNYEQKYNKKLNLIVSSDSIELSIANVFYKKITNIKYNIQSNEPLNLFINYELLRNGLRALNADKPQIGITNSNKIHIISDNNLIVIAPQVA